MTQEEIRQTIQEFTGTPLGLYDNNSPDQKSVIADKAIDVTDICKSCKQVIIKYANVARGRIAQICDLYEPGKDLGTTVHYHIDEMNASQLCSDAVFVSRAVNMGASSYQLAKTIIANS